MTLAQQQLKEANVKVRIKAALPQLVSAAQLAYEAFQPKDDVSFGACGEIAEAIAAKLRELGFKDVQLHYDEDEEGLTHVMVDAEDISIDVPWYNYEESVGHDQLFVVKSGVKIISQMFQMSKI